MNRRQAAWIRYGGPIGRAELEDAARRCSVAILQPWETDAAAYLKQAAPDLVVLQYRCLSSVRDYEPGPTYSSGVSWAQAEEHDCDCPEGEEWFARRRDGSRAEWAGYPGHWQMRHWVPSYRRAWLANVQEALTGTAFDGVMADNDVFDDYYELGLPLLDGTTVDDLRASLDDFVPWVGRALVEGGWILVPNVAESRRDPGRWARHGAYGGAFEECWLSWSPGTFLSPGDQLRQLVQVMPGSGPELVVARIATDGSCGEQAHPAFRYGLAAWWLVGEGRPGGFAATAHDDYSGPVPWVPELGWDLGRPLGPARVTANALHRDFEGGWCALHVAEAGTEAVRITTPAGLVDREGRAVAEVTLAAAEGVLLRRP
ncbi:putative glycoside hydrolase [Arsenicicoccus dermatophilus]|uniref:putative glycoside hydrolase n=1 Tax=Arsenicicoccus dermatophilus TaxID=1076331 RepID=UPI003916D8A5